MTFASAAAGNDAGMENERDDQDFAERAADATEETRRERGEEGVTIEDSPGEGEISEHPERQL